MVMNASSAGAGMIMTPFAMINDGLMDIIWVSDPAANSLFSLADIMNDSKNNGDAQAYNDQCNYMRGHQIRIVY